MAWDSQGIGAGLLINAIITPVLAIVAYWLLHKTHACSIDVWRVFRPKRPADPPTFFNFGGQTGARFLTWRDTWVEKNQNAEAVLYLLWLKWIALVFGTIAIFTCSVLIPVNITDDYNEVFHLEENPKTDNDSSDFEPGVADWTPRNVHPKSNRLWAHWVIMLLVSVEVWAMIVNLLYAFRDLKSKQKPTKTAEMFDVKSKEEAMANIPADLHSTVARVDIPRLPPKGMLDVIEKRQVALRKLEHFYAEVEEKKISDPLGPELKMGCCNSENPIKHWRAKVDKYDKQLAAFKKQADSEKPAGGAFVTFTSSQANVNFLVTKEGKKSSVFAPPGKAVLWDNLGANPTTKMIASFLVCCLLVFLVLIWAALTSALASIDELVKDVPVLGDIVNVHPEIAGLITTYLPIIMLVVLMIVLPIFMRALTQYAERVGNKVEREYYVLRKYYLFLLWATVILVAAASGIGDTGLDTIASASADTMLAAVTSMISPIAGFFTMLIIQAACMGSLLKLLRLGDVIVGRLLATIALTEYETQEAYKMKAFLFSEEYTSALLVYSIAMLFGVTVPYMPFFASFYFVMRFLVDRNALCDIYPHCRPSDLRSFPFVLQSCLAMLSGSQLFLVALMGVKEKWVVCGLSCIPLFMSLVGHVLLHFQTTDIMSPEFYKQIQDGQYEKKQPVPHIAGFLVSLICTNEGEVGESMELESSGAEEKVDRHGYGSPAQAYDEPETCDHEAMAKKSFLKVPAKEMDPNDVECGSVCASSTYFPGRGGLYQDASLKEVDGVSDSGDEAVQVEGAAPVDDIGAKPTEPTAEGANPY